MKIKLLVICALTFSLKLFPIYQYGLNFYAYEKLPDKEQQFLDAAANNNITEVKKFIDQGIDINIQTWRGESALYIASKAGHKDMITFLISAGINVNLRYIYGTTALMWAMRTTHYDKEIIKIFLLAGADVNLLGDYGQWGPLFEAICGSKDVEAVALIIQAGADVNITSEGDSVLMAAVYQKNIDIVKLLLASGARTDSINYDHMTALDIAIARKCNGIASLLKEHLK